MIRLAQWYNMMKVWWWCDNNVLLVSLKEECKWFKSKHVNCSRNFLNISVLNFTNTYLSLMVSYIQFVLTEEISRNVFQWPLCIHFRHAHCQRDQIWNYLFYTYLINQMYPCFIAEYNIRVQARCVWIKSQVRQYEWFHYTHPNVFHSKGTSVP